MPVADDAWVAIEDRPAGPTRAPATGFERRTDRRLTAAGRLRRHDRIALGAFDAAAHVFQRRARQLMAGSAVFLVPAIALNVGLSIVAYDRFGASDTRAVSPETALLGIDAASGVESWFGYFAILGSSWSAAIVGAYATAVLLRDEFGRDPSSRSALAATVRRLPRLSGAWLFGHAWMLLVALIAVNASSAALSSLVTPGIGVLGMLTTLTVVVSPVVVTEQLGPVAGVRRGVRLARSRFGPAFAFVIITTVIGGGLRAGISALPRLAELTGLIGFGSYRWLVAGVAGQVAQLVVVPLVGLATAQLYLQLRADAEGMDIVLAADAAFGGAST